MTKNDKPLRILSLDVENILRVVAVHIEPNGRVVELTGRNRQGKSSVIQALWMALGGKDHIPNDPIHDGAEMGKVVVELGDDSGTKYIVTRKIKAKEGGGNSLSLTVENEDGFKSDKPQKILDSLIGALSCDPLEFINMKPKEQVDLLKRFVPGLDFDGIEKANQADFTARTDINRDAKARRNQVAGIVVDDTLLTGRTDEAALVAELAGASEANAKVERWKSSKTSLEQHIEQSRAAAAQNLARAVELRRQANEADQLAVTCGDQAAEFETQLEKSGPCPETVDTAALQAKISAARAANEKVDANLRAQAERHRLTSEAEALEARAANLTKAMSDRDAAKTKAIAEAKMPVDGIDFGDSELYFEGHPLATASQAQKLQIAIAIAAALQPRLRFITTKNGALLDDESFAELARLAEERDLLVICETVRSDRPSAVVIEDGHVRGAVRQAAE